MKKLFSFLLNRLLKAIGLAISFAVLYGIGVAAVLLICKLIDLGGVFTPLAGVALLFTYAIVAEKRGSMVKR